MSTHRNVELFVCGKTLWCRAVLGCVAALGCCSTLLGCANTYMTKTAGAREALVHYQPEKAVDLLDKAFPKGPAEKDNVLFLLDKGTFFRAAKRFDESNQFLARAEKLSEALDVASVSEEAAALFSNEGTKTYRTEDFEKLMMSVVQGLNYAEKGDEEGALVEMRRVNQKLRKMVADEKKPYQQLAIARYLSGILYENAGDLDAAAIDYIQAAKLQHLGLAAEPALRLAQETGREDDYEALLRAYPSLPHKPLLPSEGQLVVLVEMGLIVEKQSSKRNVGGDLQSTVLVVPVYPQARRTYPRVTLVVGGQSVQTEVVTSLDKVARIHLNERIDRMVAKSAAALLVKGGIAAAVGAATRNTGLGALTFLLLASTQEADTRSWGSLPAEYQVARLRLNPGKHVLKVRTPSRNSEHEVEIKPRRVSLLVLRLF